MTETDSKGDATRGQQLQYLYDETTDQLKATARSVRLVAVPLPHSSRKTESPSEKVVVTHPRFACWEPAAAPQKADAVDVKLLVGYSGHVVLFEQLPREMPLGQLRPLLAERTWLTGVAFTHQNSRTYPERSLADNHVTSTWPIHAIVRMHSGGGGPHALHWTCLTAEERIRHPLTNAVEDRKWLWPGQPAAVIEIKDTDGKVSGKSSSGGKNSALAEGKGGVTVVDAAGGPVKGYSSRGVAKVHASPAAAGARPGLTFCFEDGARSRTGGLLASCLQPAHFALWEFAAAPAAGGEHGHVDATMASPVPCEVTLRPSGSEDAPMRSVDIAPTEDLRPGALYAFGINDWQLHEDAMAAHRQRWARFRDGELAAGAAAVPVPAGVVALIEAYCAPPAPPPLPRMRAPDPMAAADAQSALPFETLHGYRVFFRLPATSAGDAKGETSGGGIGGAGGAGSSAGDGKSGASAAAIADTGKMGGDSDGLRSRSGSSAKSGQCLVS